tara:strand:- start:2036 stop:2752 length:717 start_codon:yes stop_codon:yes gene_type:complete
MPCIKGTLTVPNKDWKYVYNSILNFVNEEIENAYSKAIKLYSKIKDDSLSLETVIQDYELLIQPLSPSTYQKELVHSALFSGTNNYIYSPKKNNFKKFTNRTTFIDTGAVRIEIDKKTCTINLKTEEFANLDQYILANTFISEFINMVNTIPWPTRNGPSEAIRGCKLFTVEKENITIFYKAGPRPPELVSNLTIVDSTTKEPSHLAASLTKNMHFVSSSQEETSQPLPDVNNTFDDY